MAVVVVVALGDDEPAQGPSTPDDSAVTRDLPPESTATSSTVSGTQASADEPDGSSTETTRATDAPSVVATTEAPGVVATTEAPSAATDNRGCTITGAVDVVEIIGTEGDDVLCVPNPADPNAFHVLDGRGGDDIIYGGEGVDWVYGGDGADIIYAYGEADRIVAGTGIDTIHSGAGLDYIYVIWLEDVIHDEPDGYQLEVSADPNNERAEPVAEDDWAWVDARYTVVIDVLENDYDFYNDIDPTTLTIIRPPVTGIARIEESGGSRVIVYAGEHSTIESLRYQVCDALGACSEAEVEIMVGTEACTIVGTHMDETLEGTSGDDVICGLEGDDYLLGSGGSDIFIGGPGNDSLSAGRNTNYDPNDAADVLWGGLGDDSISGDGHDDVIYGGAGDDRLRGWAGADRVYGGTGDDVLLGFDGDDRLFGGLGDDELDGHEGTDHLDGGDGRDSCINGDVILACELRPQN